MNAESFLWGGLWACCGLKRFFYGRALQDSLLYLKTGNGQTYREAISALTNALVYINITSLSEADDAFPAERTLRKAMKVFLSLIGDARGSVGSLGVYSRALTSTCQAGELKGLHLTELLQASSEKCLIFDKEENIIPAMKPEGAEKRFFLRSNCGVHKTREALRFVLREAACQDECEGYFKVLFTAKGKRRKRLY